MKKLFSCLLVLFVTNTSQGQIFKKLADATGDLLSSTKKSIDNAVESNRLTNIADHIKERDLPKAYEKLRDFQSKYTLDTRYYYLKHLYYKTVSENIKGVLLVVESRTNLQQSMKYYYNFYGTLPYEAADKDCKKIGLCVNDLPDQMKEIDKSLYYLFKNTDDSLTFFITEFNKSLYKVSKGSNENDYQKSIYYDSAIEQRNSIRYKEALEKNTKESFGEFIRINPSAKEIQEAKKYHALLSYKYSEKINETSAYQNFINEFRYATFLVEKAKFNIKILKINEIKLECQQFFSENNDLIKRITDNQLQNRREYETTFQDISYKMRSLKYKIEEIKYPNTKGSSILDIYVDQFKSIDEEADFIYANNAREDFDKYSRFISQHPNSKYISIVKNTKERFELLKHQKDSVEQVRRAEYARQQAIEEEIRKVELEKQKKESDPIYQLKQKLSTTDANLLDKILSGKSNLVGLKELYDDQLRPRVCGTSNKICSFCSRSFSYNRTLEDRSILLMFVRMWNSKGILISKSDLYDYTNKSLEETKKENINYIKNQLSLIRSGNHVYCNDPNPKYCFFESCILERKRNNY